MPARPARSTRRLLTAAPAALALVGTLVGGAAPASAAKTNERDPVGDTTLVTSDGRVPAPVRNADITHIYTRHGPVGVRVTVVIERFRYSRYSFAVLYATPDGDYVARVGRHTRTTFGPVDEQGRRAPSCRPTVLTNFDTDRLTLRISRECLGNPDWVRTGAGSRAPTGDRFHADDARRRGGPVGEATELTLGPRVDAEVLR